MKIAEYNGLDEELDQVHPFYWPGGVPPLDRTIKREEKTTVNIRIYAVLVTFSSLGIVTASIFLSFNIHYRNQRLETSIYCIYLLYLHLKK